MQESLAYYLMMYLFPLLLFLCNDNSKGRGIYLTRAVARTFQQGGVRVGIFEQREFADKK